MIRHLRFLLVAAMSLLVLACQKEEGNTTYYAPTEVVLNVPDINASTLNVRLSAVYNGADSGVASAGFDVKDESGTKIPVSEFTCGEGSASAVLSGLSLGHTYSYNFVITTKGGNTVKSEEEGVIPLSIPSEFTYSTLTTKTSKIFQMAFDGSSAFIKDVALTLLDESGTPLSNLPKMSVQDGMAHALFVLTDWVQDIYTAYCDLTLADGSTVRTPEVLFALIPLVEHATVCVPATTEDGKWTFSAEYDGEDKTISEAYFEVFDDADALISTVPATCKSGKATGYSEGNTYGKFAVRFVVKVVGGGEVSAGPLKFSVAKPRAYEALLVDNVGFYEKLGGPTAAIADPTTYTYLGYDWEFINLFIKPTKTPPYFIVDKSKYGSFANDTGFELGIKRLIINLTNSKEIKNFSCYGRASTADEWTVVSGVRETVSGDPNVQYRFVYDMPVGNFQFFMFESTANTSEIRMYSFEVDYFTEPEASGD